jgi:DNA polymerase-3 subunit gamma/tau
MGSDTSLHTRYRPKTFEQVIGQRKVVASLKKAVSDRRAHTFLLTGPSGTGKTTLARIMAAAWSGGTDQQNLLEIDGASKSGADDIREIIKQTHYRAIGKSPVKTVLIDEFHRLSGAAVTVLLKPIEEPPSHIFWVFCTTEAGKIPITIKTRCVKHDLSPVSEDDIISLILDVNAKEQLKVQDEVLEVVVEAAGGSPRQALVLLEACSACESAAQAREICKGAGQAKEVRDLCRFLLQRNGRSWAEGIKIVRQLDGKVDAESARIAIVAYLQSVLMSTKSDQQARPLLGLLDAFKTPYVQTDRFAPLLYSLGLALGLDQ